MNTFLEGKRIILKILTKEDLRELGKLMVDKEIRELVAEVYPLTEKDIESFFEKCQNVEERIWFVIIDKETNKLIGETGFKGMYPPWRSGEFTLILWDRNYWSKGYGREVAQLMLEYGFNTLNMHRIYIEVAEFNVYGLKFWERLSFKKSGTLVEGYFCRGKYYDFIMMYMLENEFRELTSLQR
jgi:RimJ/RimL family protein N-acetyltransferase